MTKQRQRRNAGGLSTTLFTMKLRTASVEMTNGDNDRRRVWLAMPVVLVGRSVRFVPVELEFVGLFDQVYRQVLDDFEGFVFVQTMFGYEATKEGAVDSAGHVVAGRD